MTCVENSGNNIIIKPTPPPLRFSYSLGNILASQPKSHHQYYSSSSRIFGYFLATSLHTLSSQFPYTLTLREDHHHHHPFLVLKKEKKEKKKKKHKQSRKNQPEIDMKLFSLFSLLHA